MWNIYDGSAEISGSLTIEGKRFRELVESIQRYADFAAEYDASIEIEVDFIPDELKTDNFAPFAAVGVQCVNGKVIVNACRYDTDR